MTPYGDRRRAGQYDPKRKTAAKQEQTATKAKAKPKK